MRRPNHPVFAFVYDWLAAPAQRWEARYREELCAGARGRVLELGAGTGLNFAHYRSARRVVAVEPEPHMLRRAARRAAEAPVPVTLVAAVAEALPLRDGAFDAVVCSLVLCSVRDLGRALGECRRVLAPQGELRLYEHVRSPRPGVARLQDRLERPWRRLAGGCHPNRDTVGTLRAQGFRVEVRAFDPPVLGGPLLPHVLGVARPAAADVAGPAGPGPP
ncbi:MAG TPA: class I SAM-dependent methyltransferase [Actinomycetota bacterium]|nr:class I SAM-dependent methyltransferase [Actinomycetota bacterium]